jgi:hypothetical protein
LSPLQLERILYSESSPTYPPRQSIAPTSQSKQTLIENGILFTFSVLSYIASKYAESTIAGDEFLKSAVSVLLFNLYPTCLSGDLITFNSLSPVTKLASKCEYFDTLINLINSNVFSDKLAVVKTLIVQFASYPKLKAFGLKLMELPEFKDTIADWTKSLSNHHKVLSEYLIN